MTEVPIEEERALDERRHAVGHELVERLDVVRQPADDHARAVALVEAEREPLQVAEELVAQVGEDALARPAGEVRLRGARPEVRATPATMNATTMNVSACRSLRRGCRRRSRAWPGSGGASAVAVAAEQRAERERRPPLVRRASRASVETRRASPPRPVVDLGAALLRRWLPGCQTLIRPPSLRRARANSRSSSPCS